MRAGRRPQARRVGERRGRPPGPRGRGGAAFPLAASLLWLGACAPAVKPLTGLPAPAVLPPTAIAPVAQRLRFTWGYRDETFEAQGDGVVRVQGPDRARLDFFLRNGLAGGYAILVGDSLFVPGIDLVRRVLPPEPLLWATLGRVALPPTPDTAARLDGDTLRADLGTLRGGDATRADGRAWRLAFAGRELARVERIEGGALVEWVARTRGDDGQWRLRYVHERGRRRLDIAVTDTLVVEEFDDEIWRRR
jgi:hypothetical protein